MMGADSLSGEATGDPGPRLSVLSLFSGAGGMDLGVNKAGFKILAAIELDPHCCETLRANFTPDSRVIESDVRAIDPYALQDELDMHQGDIDLLCGGPPCQPFSQIGLRGGLHDPRAQLLFEMVRFAEAFKPKAIFMEQVKGVLTAPGPDGERGSMFAELVRRLKALGYTVHPQILNSAEYGVAQRRERLILVAVREGLSFSFPEPTHQTPLSVGQALRGLALKPPVVNGHPVADNHVDVTPDGQRRRIHDVPEGQWLAAQLHLPVEIRQTLKRKDTTKFRRLSRSEPSLTLRCGEIFFHPLKDRYLTPREYMRLHGFPDSYVLKGPIRSRSGQVRNLDQHRQVANSVPPPVAEAVASQIRHAIS
jgi:DNA (cytosine-5)-methyltransferase 1